jgi:signal transduction histidine kinase
MSDRLRILYAEDDRFDADQLTAHIAQHAPDLTVDVVGSGEQCLARLADETYAVLLLDNHLPDMDGLDVLKALAARDQSLPVVVVTGVGDEQLVVQVLGMGAIDYIPKHGNYLEKVPAVLRNAVVEQRLLPERHALGRRRERRVLYVERHPYDIDLTLRHFTQAAAHLTVEVVRSTTEGLARLQEAPFDLVLADLRMPDLSALYLLKATRSREIVVPFIVITGQGDELAAVAALKLGAYDYIVKRDNYLTQLPYAIDHAIARYELEHLNQRLESELAERRRVEANLREQAVALADAARQREEFLAMLGHELRNPLAPIRTALELLRHFSSEDPTAVHTHQVLERQITHMVRLLDDVLDVARITRGRITLEMQRLDLRTAVIEAIDNARPLLDARKHRLRTAFSSDPLIVRGDSTRLVQVAQNLLNNAAKYTDQGGTIDISATREGSYAVLRVQDSGTGISPSLLPRIFDLFTQDDQALDRAQGGLGLGLTLVRRIVELHDGSVEAHSEGRGRGSTFTIKLPVLLADQAADAAPDGGSRPFAAGLLRCLVVEDNVDAAEMLKVALEWEGHAVRLAFDGEDAIVAASAFQPDVIVLDIGLPSTNGYETARAIRLLPGLQNAIIIATTGYGQDSDRHKSRDAGINYHLVKPVKIEALLGAIAAARASLSKH